MLHFHFETAGTFSFSGPPEKENVPFFYLRARGEPGLPDQSS